MSYRGYDSGLKEGLPLEEVKQSEAQESAEKSILKWDLHNIIIIINITILNNKIISTTKNTLRHADMQTKRQKER